MEDIEIYIFSSSGYSDFWLNNLILLDKYWPNHPKVSILSNGIGEYGIGNYNCLKIYDGVGSERLINAINDCQSKYIIYFHEDFLLSKPVDAMFMELAFKYIKENNIDYCKFANSRRKSKKIIIKRIKLDKVYSVSFYPCIWKVESLKKVLHSNEDIWESEVRLTQRAKENCFNCFCLKEKHIYPAIHSCERGKYVRNAYKFLKRNNLFVSNRPILSLKESMFSFFYHCTPRPIKTLFKKMSSKNKKHYYSDCVNNDEQ